MPSPKTGSTSPHSSNILLPHTDAPLPHLRLHRLPIVVANAVFDFVEPTRFMSWSVWELATPHCNATVGRSSMTCTTGVQDKEKYEFGLGTQSEDEKADSVSHRST